MTDAMDDAIQETLDGLQSIGIHGGYREKVEALEVLASMSWFDNFGEPHYRRRIHVAERIADGVNEEDIPDTLPELHDD